MARDAPERILSRAAKAERRGRIFLDWMRNGRGASAILPFSTRAREGAPVAATLRWEEIARFRPGALDVRTVRQRLARLRADPWADYWQTRQALPAAPQR
jgi:bifunctional non-homologous end joining protein LigD